MAINRAEHLTFDKLFNGVWNGVQDERRSKREVLSIKLELDTTEAEEKIKSLCDRCEKLNEAINGFSCSTEELTKRMTEITRQLREAKKETIEMK